MALSLRMIPSASIAFAALAACTYDYDQFHPTLTSSSGATSAGGASSSASTGGAGATGPGAGGSTVSAGGSGVGGGGCNAGQKSCGGSCVSVDDPSFGCTASGCQPCSVSHATASCSGGACVVASCDAGFLDCSASSAGCEVDGSSDPANCGTCGNTCKSGFVCTTGACLCDADADCNGGTCVPSGTNLGRCKCASTVCGPNQACISTNQCG